MCHHAFLLAFDGSSGPRPQVLRFLEAGHISVGIFIVLSGFCLFAPIVRAGNTLRGGALGFYWRRARRILPTYFIALGMAYVLWAISLGGWGTEPGAVTWASLASHLTLTHNLFKHPAPNPALWSVALEFQIYLVVPLLVLAVRWFSFLPAALLFVIIGYELPRIGVGVFGYWFLSTFTIGATAAYIVFGSGAAIEAIKRAVPWRVLSVLLFAAASGIIYRYGIFERIAWLDIVISMASSASIIAMCQNSRLIPARLLSSLPLERLGLFSYSLYLIHMPLLQAIYKVGMIANAPPLLRFAILELVAVPVVVFLAYRFFLVAEKPFLSVRQKAAVKDLLDTPSPTEDSATTPASQTA